MSRSTFTLVIFPHFSNKFVTETHKSSSAVVEQRLATNTQAEGRPLSESSFDWGSLFSFSVVEGGGEPDEGLGLDFGFCLLATLLGDNTEAAETTGLEELIITSMQQVSNRKGRELSALNRLNLQPWLQKAVYGCGGDTGKKLEK